MNFCGIICEFNPFHNGHKYLIEEAKKLTGAEILCLMSGEFVQRGTPAIEEKHNRASKAIANGASAVLELPTIYACSNAENFASGAIKILKALGVKFLAFGIEETTLDLLNKIAELKLENSNEFRDAFKNEIENGINFNTALKRTIASTLKDEKILEVLNKPNNILAVEYLTAIKRQNANIEPVAILRSDNGFLSEKNIGKFLSASAIRDKIQNGENVDQFIPKNAKVVDFFQKNNGFQLNLLKKYAIISKTEKQLESLYDFCEGIEYRIKKVIKLNLNFDETLSKISTPRYRRPRVEKLLIYPLLEITKKVIKTSFKTKAVARVLAVDKNEKTLLKNYNKNKINLIVKNADYENLSKAQKEIIDIDLKASEIYNLITNKQINNDKKIGTLFV